MESAGSNNDGSGKMEASASHGRCINQVAGRLEHMEAEFL
jgi:hypothetical protein